MHTHTPQHTHKELTSTLNYQQSNKCICVRHRDNTNPDSSVLHPQAAYRSPPQVIIAGIKSYKLAL